MYEFELHKIIRRQKLDAGGEVTILQELDACFEMGQLSVLLGPSGGGKTTVLRLLNRLDSPDSGQIVRRGKPLDSYPVRQLRRKVAFMPQQPKVFKGSLKENLLLPLTFCQSLVPEPTQSAFNELLEKVGLEVGLIDRPATELSGGEKQRLALARLLLIQPEVLLLDEPANGLDPPAREQLNRLLRQQVASGVTVVLSSHDIPFTRRVADNFLFLNQGRISVQGKIEELESPQDQALRHFVDAEGETC